MNLVKPKKSILVKSSLKIVNVIMGYCKRVLDIWEELCKMELLNTGLVPA